MKSEVPSPGASPDDSTLRSQSSAVTLPFYIMIRKSHYQHFATQAAAHARRLRRQGNGNILPPCINDYNSITYIYNINEISAI
jgi:hypothetical protein